MPRYRKKPIVVEATRWRGFVEGPHHLGVVPYSPDGQGWIETLEGGHQVTPGDWIITGVAGEKYPCKDAIFQATYEAVLDD